MAYDFQITIDATEPHALADWWADTLGWEVEPSDEDFIRRMISEGYATDAETTTHNDVLVWTSPHTWITLADPEGNEFCLA